MAEKKLITDEMIANYHKAVIKFNEDIKKSKYRQTLCENFISGVPNTAQFSNLVKINSGNSCFNF